MSQNTAPHAARTPHCE